MNTRVATAQYPGLLGEIKQRIRAAQMRAMLGVNVDLIRLYWEIGRMLDARLAQNLRYELPEVKGFSERTIKRMLVFYREYRELEFVPQPVAQMARGFHA